MKITLLLSIVCLSTNIIFSQYSVVEQTKNSYDQWSLALDAGINKPTRNFTTSYYSGLFNGYHINGTLRYMFDHKIGIGGNLSFGRIEPGSNSSPFGSEYISVNLQTYVNLGRILKFEDFAERLNLQFHAGMGYMNLYFDDISPFSDIDDGFSFTTGDDLAVVIAGLRPQYKLSSKFALYLDVSVNGTIRQNMTFDGFTNESDAQRPQKFDQIQAPVYTASLGVQFYIGKEEEHADWYMKDEQPDPLDRLEKKLVILQNAKKDKDGDGISDYIEQNNNIKENGNVVFEEDMINENDSISEAFKSYINKVLINNNKLSILERSTKNIIYKYVKNLYVYFDFDVKTPERYSIPEIYKLKKVLDRFTDTRVELIGYADEIGNKDYNDRLSYERAKSVKEILVELGIARDRIDITSGGEVNNVDKRSEEARHIVRQVKFKLIED